MAVNKVEINTENGKEVLIDLTTDTVTPETLAEGVTAHAANGQTITGTMTASGGGASFPTGTEGQIIGYDSSGKVVAMDNAALIQAQQAMHAAVITGEGALVVPIIEQMARLISGDFVEFSDGIGWIHWSSKVPTMSDLKKGFALHTGEPIEAEGMASGMNGQSVEILPEAFNPEVFQAMVVDIGGCIAIGEIMILIIPNDGFSLPLGENTGIIFPKKGIWVMSMLALDAIRINGYSFSAGGEGNGKAEELYFGSAKIVDNALTWDGDTTGLEASPIGGINFFKVSSIVPPVEDFSTTPGKVVTKSSEMTEERNFIKIMPDSAIEGWFAPVMENGQTVDHVIIAATDISVTAEGLDINFSAGIWFANLTDANDRNIWVSSLSIDGYTWPAEVSAGTGTSDSGPLYINATQTEDGYTFDRTLSEAEAAIDAGRMVVLAVFAEGIATKYLYPAARIAGEALAFFHGMSGMVLSLTAEGIGEGME